MQLLTPDAETAASTLAERLVSAFIEAIASKDLTSITGLYRDDAWLISTMIPHFHKEFDAIRTFYMTYFRKVQETSLTAIKDVMIITEDANGDPHVISVAGSIAVEVTGLFSETSNEPSDPLRFCTDFTMVWCREGRDDWKIVKYQETRPSPHSSS